jgi:hypothetical protein
MVEGDLVALVFYLVFWVEVHKVDPLLSFGATVFGVVAWLPATETGEVSPGGACRRRIGAIGPWLGPPIVIAVWWASALVLACLGRSPHWGLGAAEVHRDCFIVHPSGSVG